MNVISLNCRGAGGSLCSSKMCHIKRLIHSTEAKVIFISEVKSNKYSRVDLIKNFSCLIVMLYQLTASLGVFGFCGLMMRKNIEHELANIQALSPYHQNYMLDNALCKEHARFQNKISEYYRQRCKQR